MAIASPYLLIITLSVNRLNSIIKRYKMVEQIKKEKTNKTQLHAYYKGLTSTLRTHIG